MKTFTPFIIMAVCVGMYFLYISPTWAEVAVLSAKKSEYKNVLAKVKELKTERDTAIAAYNNISPEDIEKLDKIVPDKFDSVLFVNDISSLGLKYGLVMGDFTTDAPKTVSRDIPVETTGPYRTVTVTLRLTGSFDSFVKFLKDMETSLQLVDVVSLTINSSPSKTSSGENNMQYVLEMHTYSLE